MIRLIKSISALSSSPARLIKYNGKAQALPIVLAMLALGALVITPFLNHAGVNLKSSANYTALMQANNSCEAGIEEAIWALNYNNLSSQLSHIGDSLSYRLNETVNQLNTDVSVTLLNSEGGTTQGVPGTIGDNLVASSQFADFAYTPKIIHISANIYAIVFRDSSTAGRLVTLTIMPDGSFGSQIIDSLTFYSRYCYEPVITQVSGNIYAIAFRGANDDGFISTVSIDTAGQIGNDNGSGNGNGWDWSWGYWGWGWGNGGNASGVINTFEFDTSGGYEPSIIKIGDSYLAIAYRGSGWNGSGCLKTVNINSSGQINQTITDSLVFDTAAGYEPEIKAISGEYYAIAYRGLNNDGYVKICAD